MDLKALRDTPSWDWPDNAGKMILEILTNDRADDSDRLLAAELAGDFTVINEELVGALLSILREAVRRMICVAKRQYPWGRPRPRRHARSEDPMMCDYRKYPPDDPEIAQKALHGC